MISASDIYDPLNNRGRLAYNIHKNPSGSSQEDTLLWIIKSIILILLFRISMSGRIDPRLYWTATY